MLMYLSWTRWALWYSRNNFKNQDYLQKLVCDTSKKRRAEGIAALCFFGSVKRKGSDNSPEYPGNRNKINRAKVKIETCKSNEYFI